ncbi:MAG: ribonuclease P protein component [Bacteroidales bacterium]|nr:ribonuclease P protein component [Bacteroidales bacterium]MCF8344166.1 ribonuclease P protein component [Bacteroidales bacterium]MCF8351125.1 ribonuclease P protein component [Bacteroidales bacterium]MCF8374813.1 ribonuclease P protein component [Bacteroidales bacterium]MCF8399783.1 ribonuclease P protein component [Bacteroidales bacterium]
MQTFKKPERLRSKKLIDKLFSRGNSFFIYPFKVLWMEAEFKGDSPVQVLIGISRKNKRLAVDRNKIKRLIREAYRKNKLPYHEYLRSKQKKVALGLIYVGKETSKYAIIEQKIIEVFERLTEEHEKTIG